MAKQRSGSAKKPKRQKKAMRKLERRIAALEREGRALRKRLKKLAKRLDAATAGRGPRPQWPPGPPGPPPGFFLKRGGPPWTKGVGPVVSLEVPLETDDPAAPLWATVAARIPEEITTVGDDGRLVRYRYSAVGSTAQAPRYRQVGEAEEAPETSENGPPPGFRA